MRIISQDGVYDTPYETTQLWVQERNEVTDLYYIRGNMPADEAIPIAIYSSEEKALKAMEMLRKAYENNEFYHYTAGSKHFEEIQSLLSEEQFRKATTEYFQFPQDDEIEV